MTKEEMVFGSIANLLGSTTLTVGTKEDFEADPTHQILETEWKAVKAVNPLAGVLEPAASV